MCDNNVEVLTRLPEDPSESDSLSFSPPLMKHSDTRDSISSIDSDVSLSFDQTPTPASPRRRTSSPAHCGDLSDSGSDAGSAEGKDSGCEVTAPVREPPFNPPSEELAEKIVAQVEFYFSDVNITKDAFLLKHVKRNKEGYVSLKLISSFKRVKHLTKDWRVVASALLRSKKLEINEAGTKLRRTEPLPPYDQTAPSRTVVATYMPIEKPTIENVAEIFSSCGEIALIRVLRPGNPAPADVRQFINKNPTLAGQVCALVEFTDSASARMAMKLMETYTDMKVYELNCVPNPERKKRISQSKKTTVNRLMESEYSSSCASGSEAENDPRLRLRRGKSAHLPPRALEPNMWLQRRLSAASVSSDSSGYCNSMYHRRLSASSRDSGSDMYLSRRFSACSMSGSEYSSSVASRRVSTASSYDSDAARSRSNSLAFHLPDNVVRMPQGPDGSKGFRYRIAANAAV